MKEIWELCRKLDNPKRLALLLRLYRDYKDPKHDGFTVSTAQDQANLYQPATSQYLKQLEELGLIRRERSGKHVSYYPDFSAANPSIATIADMLRKRMQTDSEDLDFAAIFPVMKNAFRAKVVNIISRAGKISKEELAERFGKPLRILTRDLEPAVKAGIIDADSDDLDGLYVYCGPQDPIAQKIISLST